MYFPKVRHQRPPTCNHHFHRKIQHFFWRGHGQKYSLEFVETRHIIQKIIFLQRRPGRSTPAPHPFLVPNKPYRSAPVSPHNSSQIYATDRIHDYTVTSYIKGDGGVLYCLSHSPACCGLFNAEMQTVPLFAPFHSRFSAFLAERRCDISRY